MITERTETRQRRREAPRGIPICSKCNRENDRPAQRYCMLCHAAYMRDWRKTHPLSEEGKKRDNARSYAKEYKKRGILTQSPCRVCGDKQSEMHHPDHELPLVVVWLCRKCHLAWHSFWREIAAEAWAFWDAKARTPEIVATNDAQNKRETNAAFREAS